MVKYSAAYLSRLEDLISESNYILRYEKGNFKSGYCILRDENIIIVNKFYAIEGKINVLIEILRNVPLNTEKFSEKNMKLYEEVTQKELRI